MLAEEEVDTIATYWAVLREMSKSDEPDPKDGAATLRSQAQKYGG